MVNEQNFTFQKYKVTDKTRTIIFRHLIIVKTKDKQFYSRTHTHAEKALAYSISIRYANFTDSHHHQQINTSTDSGQSKKDSKTYDYLNCAANIIITQRIYL